MTNLLQGITPNSSALAQYWIEQGYSIFPVGSNKKPHNGYKWGDYPITDISEAALRWNGGNKGAGVGIITGKKSNLLVLDIDNKNGVDGSASLEELEMQYGKLPETFMVQTPSGGYHYYFKYNDCGLTIDAGVLEGVDYRGESGYVVAAGSLTKDGQYTIVSDHPVANAPKWLVDVLKRDKILLRDKQKEEGSPSNFLSTGSRNNDLTSFAGTMRRKGMEQEQIEISLLSINQTLSEPLPEQEVCAIAKSVAKYPPSETTVYATEQDFSEHLAKKLEGKIRYVLSIGFIVNQHSVWKRDAQSLIVKRIVQEAAAEACEELSKIAMSQRDDNKKKAILKLGNKLKNNAFQNNVIAMLKAHPALVTYPEDLDTHQNIIGLKNGLFNLDSKAFISDGGVYLVTKNLNVEYELKAKCPVFDQMIERLFPEENTRHYVMKSLAYAMSGTADLQEFFIWVGSGANGKSTLIEAISYAMNDYAVTLDPNSFIRKNSSSISNDIARLRGARLCVTSETSAGAILDVALVKRLVGGDKISARFLYQEEFEFSNKAIIFMLTNFMPVFDGADGGFVRRVRIVPFNEVISAGERDPKLLSKLKLESSGILNRLLEAYEAYKNEGLTMSPIIAEATHNFCNQSNLIKQFINEHISIKPDAKSKSGDVYQAYRNWSRNSGYKPISENIFTTAFEAQTECIKKRFTDCNYWVGLELPYVPQINLFYQ